MRIIYLTHEEAADPLVVANITEHMAKDRYIAYLDRPDVGAEIVRPLAPSAPVVHHMTLVADPAVCFAAAVAQPTAPDILIPPAPGVPTIPAPPTALAAAVPTPPAAPPSPASAGTEVDREGIPWDPRIHASSKLRNSTDGRWRQKREVDPALLTSVKAELLALMAIPTPAPPTMASMAAALALPPPSPSTFADLMIWLTPVMTLGKITQPQMVQALADLGGLPGLATRQDLIPAAFARLHALVAP